VCCVGVCVVCVCVCVVCSCVYGVCGVCVCVWFVCVCVWVVCVWCGCVCVCNVFVRVCITSGNKTVFFFVCLKVYWLLFLGCESGYGNRRGCEAKITMRGRTSVARMVKNTAEILDYPNWFGPRKFGKSDCSDNQPCMRVLTQITVIDLGSSLWIVK